MTTRPQQRLAGRVLEAARRGLLPLLGWGVALVGIAYASLAAWQIAVPAHPSWVGSMGGVARTLSIVAPFVFAIPSARPPSWLLCAWTLALCPGQEWLACWR